MPGDFSTIDQFALSGLCTGQGYFWWCLFFVEDQIYTKDPEDIFKLFRGDPDTRVDASKLPQEFVASGSNLLQFIDG
ncbi:MAG: hypothetical protein IPL73_18910 [Candidatus Obscuribacter sp.]|nr:hypothetical protein [Candidatus Obscuribacter sp.]